MGQHMKFLTVTFCFLAVAWGSAAAENYPCGIDSIELKEDAVGIRFTPQASWKLGRFYSPVISNGEVVSVTDLDDDNAVWTKADVLYIENGKRLTLRMPHFTCLVTFKLTDTPPGIYVRQATYGVLGQSDTREIFYPLKR
jgi:hypothetical protein